MADRPRGPNPPRPKPVCQNNCGGVFDDDKSLGEITCPCGYGYYDFIKKEFIQGSLVRSGKVRTRSEYQQHVQQCKQKMYGAPVLGFLGAASKDGVELYHNSTKSDTKPLRISKSGVELHVLHFYISQILKKPVRIEV
jgi:hypothetical protein